MIQHENNLKDKCNIIFLDSLSLATITNVTIQLSNNGMSCMLLLPNNPNTRKMLLLVLTLV